MKLKKKAKVMIVVNNGKFIKWMWFWGDKDRV